LQTAEYDRTITLATLHALSVIADIYLLSRY